ncbi:hypothetical protein H9639_15255 [Arthrobacter sp. Sa2CUA1]|uniref:Lipoprotein n=1 Tax=Arthrobacter gallicola TaxID=2762225 RepID=A0ABR8UVR8_9MICC|nr:hypothetical protein [Arthrobacter gallicola]MBD7996655.1 hypothetical protein [Arthrobacter gallicola]
MSQISIAARQFAAITVLIGSTAVLSACTSTPAEAEGSGIPTHLPSAPPSLTADDHKEAEWEKNGFDIINGDKVTAPDGSTYQKIVLAPGDVTGAAAEWDRNYRVLEGAGWTREEYMEGFRLVSEYGVTELLDSVALETGSEGVDEWRRSGAPEKYFGPAMLGDPGLFAVPSPVLVTASEADGLPPIIPQLVHDGKPRAASVRVQMDPSIGTAIVGDNGEYLQVPLAFEVLYRVSPEAFKDFAAANPRVDSEIPETESVYRVSGEWTALVGRTADGSMKIEGAQFYGETEYGQS